MTIGQIKIVFSIICIVNIIPFWRTASQNHATDLNISIRCHMKKGFFVYGFLLVVFCLFAVITSYTNGDEHSANTAQSLEGSVLPQLIKSVDLKKDFYFADEKLPLDNFDVLQRLDNELTLNAYRHGQTTLNIKKAARYFPVIEPILKRYNIPDDLKYVAVAESDLENATSSAGAKGFWQFMPAVGKQYGLEITDEVDERYHLEKATEAACKHLASYKKHFGSWSLAVAAYNGGIGRISDALKDQKGKTLYDLNINAETSRYLFRVIALKEILSQPKKYGYYLDETDLYPAWVDFYIVEVDTAIESLSVFAQEKNISYRQLKSYNPWLISTKLTNPKRQVYQIKIPHQKF